MSFNHTQWRRQGYFLLALCIIFIGCGIILIAAATGVLVPGIVLVVTGAYNAGLVVATLREDSRGL